MGENLYCPAQRIVTKEYRDQYDRIQWTTDCKRHPKKDRPIKIKGQWGQDD